MNVTVETLAPCKRLVRFDIDPQAVEAAFESVSKEFHRHASMPGFRPGKAPRDMVLKKYESQIREEAKRKLLSENYRKAIEEHKLRVVGSPDVEEIRSERGQAFQFAVTVEIEPEFELPEYRGLPAKRENATVAGEDIDRAIAVLQERQVKFTNVDRAIQTGDFAVINYSGTCEGKPIAELAPTAQGLSSQKNFWVEVKPDSFLPGFTEQLVGAKAGEQRSVEVDFPSDFMTPELSGKHGVYSVEIVEVKEKHLPELNEEFARSYDAESMDKLREGVRSDLQNELNSKQRRSLRNQVVTQLLQRVQFDLPESVVSAETRNVVYDIVRENQQRGVPKEAIERQKDDIYNAATASARDRVKAAFLFQRIADREGIKVREDEIQTRIVTLAHGYKMAPQKFMKELEKRNGLAEVFEQLLNEKVIDFLQEHARIEDVPSAPAAAEA